MLKECGILEQKPSKNYSNAKRKQLTQIDLDFMVVKLTGSHWMKNFQSKTIEYNT